jgi:predicted ester cyclase
MSMSYEAIARQFYAAFNTGDTSLLNEILDFNWVEYPWSYPEQVPGIESYKPVITGFRTVFPDVEFTNEDVIVANDKITVRSVVTGTHSAPFLGVEPTGKKVKFNTIDIHRINEGKIVETWHIEDLFGALQQLK